MGVHVYTRDIPGVLVYNRQGKRLKSVFRTKKYSKLIHFKKLTLQVRLKLEKSKQKNVPENCVTFHRR